VISSDRQLSAMQHELTSGRSWRGRAPADRTDSTEAGNVGSRDREAIQFASRDRVVS
jgi:hypothetical protein